MEKDKQENIQEKRLKFIELLAFFHGIVSQEDIMKKFNVSVESATNTLSKYNQLAPKNLNYNTHLKSYEISPTFKPIYNMDMFLEHIPLYTIPFLNNPIDDIEIENIAIISRAIQRTHPLKITYSSVSSGITKREIVPVAFANTLIRWHLRAYDRKRKKYIDFVFKRILRVEETEDNTIKDNEHPKNDKEWHLFVELKINHYLSDRSLHNTYNVKVRSAMAGYFLQFWNVDCSSNIINLKERKYKYFLENVEEISKLANLKLAPEYEY